MAGTIENTHVVEASPLISPRSIKESLPLSPAAAKLVLDTRAAIRDIIHGRDMQRVLFVVGPCSVHDAASAREYAQRLKKVSDDVREQVVVVMRTYFEKPRTTVGWKGLINDPQLDGTCDIPNGLQIARKLLLEVNEMGVPCATEMLDPVTPQYIADLISWVAIGARTTESQTHREMASGLSMPVGFKNGTDGSMQTALNAMISASHQHSFLGINQDGITSVIKTSGNPDHHIVLRGGGGKTNYHPEDIQRATTLVSEEGTVRSVMVDCSHGNSNKDYSKQPVACREVIRQIREGQPGIMGIMVEGHLNPGAQAWKAGAKLKFGVSITDACIGWDDAEALIRETADAVASAPRMTNCATR
jgi:3-deoxy-7-phosphoheptulonate synthase